MMMKISTSLIVCLFLFAGCSGEKTSAPQNVSTSDQNQGFSGEHQAFDAVGVANGEDKVSPFGKPPSSAYVSNSLRNQKAMEEKPEIEFSTK